MTASSQISNRIFYRCLIWLCSLFCTNVIFSLNSNNAIAQVVLSQNVFPNNSPLQERPVQPPALPPTDNLIKPQQSPSIEPETPQNEIPETITVKNFTVVGSTVFTPAELAEVTSSYLHRPLTIVELYQVRSLITELYSDRGYLYSGAFIPPQTLTDGIVEIQVIEGRLESINISNSGRLNPNYIVSRLSRASETPLNSEKLLEALQLLQLDPLIQNISAELSAGIEPGTSILDVDVTIADTFAVNLITDNNRSPSVGSWQRGVGLREANLFGLGDRVEIDYLNTDGSDEVTLGYNLPVNARNGSLSLFAGYTNSEVVEDPFNFLDIQSETQDYNLSFRQPLIQTPNQELALGLTFSHSRSQTEFLEDLIDESVGFPSPGADEDGRTNISALRFSQEWINRGNRDVFALFSQLSLGLDVLGATTNSDAPDSRFFSWRGQAQWVRLLAPETLLLFSSNIQLTGDELLPLEQIGLGGQNTLRGYRENFLLTDNGLSLTGEVRLPILRATAIQGLLQLTPFIDFGTSWNSDSPNPDNNTLVSTGVGLLWQQGSRLNARLDWGIPLVAVDERGDSLQEDGIYFSIQYTLF
ncbi:MAG: ShlB/FhaC/HecB family hemolysin secretion/activation protein [Cyanobacteria bacterium P01_G01_bin.19]